jgi:sigma-B regulation protein RsbU (phosphoserine phosphatase)
MPEIADLERNIRHVESVLIALSIAAIALADRLLAPGTSLGFLYLVPMSYSALTHRWPVFLSLLLACVAFRQWDFPVGGSSWGRLALDWTLVAVFLAVVVPLRRLGAGRARFFQTARRQRDELVREVETAAAVQRHLLEQHRPPAGPIDVVARTLPARVVGGDYYDFVPLDEGRFAVVVADVSGKGLPAALIMPAVKIAVRTLAERHATIGEFVGELNRVFLDNLPPASYFTMFYGVFDVARLRFEYANCGHPPPLLVRGGTGETELLGAGGPAVGLIDEPVRYETAEAAVAPGDVIVFYTDGITEAEDETGTEFGRERLVDLVRALRGRRADALVTAIHDAVDGFRGPEVARGDDATVIVARVPAAVP